MTLDIFAIVVVSLIALWLLSVVVPLTRQGALQLGRYLSWPMFFLAAFFGVLFLARRRKLTPPPPVQDPLRDVLEEARKTQAKAKAERAEVQATIEQTHDLHELYELGNKED